MKVVEFRIPRVIARAIGADRRDFAAVLCPDDLGLDDPYYEPRVDVDVVHIRCARGIGEALRASLHTRPRRSVAEFGEACFAIVLELLEAALQVHGGECDSMEANLTTPAASLEEFAR